MECFCQAVWSIRTPWSKGTHRSPVVPVPCSGKMGFFRWLRAGPISTQESLAWPGVFLVCVADPCSTQTPWGQAGLGALALSSGQEGNSGRGRGETQTWAWT